MRIPACPIEVARTLNYATGGSVDCWPPRETCSVHFVPFQYRSSNRRDGSAYHPAGAVAADAADSATSGTDDSFIPQPSPSDESEVAAVAADASDVDGAADDVDAAAVLGRER